MKRDGSPMKSSILQLLCLAPVAVIVLFAADGCGSDGADRPNIVLVIIDTLRADLLGCYGCPENTSPEIDEMAGEGVLFERVIAQCSWTRPSIASMVTSLYPRTLGIYKEEYDILAGEHLTLAEMLKEDGYATIGITANPHLNKTFNFHQGFDEYAESSVIWGWMQPEKGKTHLREGRDINLPRSGEIFDWVLARARSGLSNPAYVQINVMEVHSPSLVLNRYRRLYDRMPVPVAEDETAKRRAALTHLVTGTYCAVKQISHDLGEFVNELRSIPGWENTLFVITSDHGQGLVDHPDVDDSAHHGNLLYDSQVWVPLILYNPADAELVCCGRRVEEMVRLLDLLPTVLSYAGVPVPDDLQGESLIGLMTDGAGRPDLPEAFVAETNWKEVNKIAAYTSDWKCILNRDGWKGVNPLELQRSGLVENGALTDGAHSHPGEARRLKLFLEDWERRFPRAGRTQPPDLPTDVEIEQLKSLGYIK